MDYRFVPCTVFTPLEYGAIGYSEEEAFHVFGQDAVSVYHRSFKPLEWNFDNSKEDDSCYGKIIVKNSDRHVIGFHYLGPNAGEVTQGYAIAIKKGVTKEEFDETVGIHPTTSEEMIGITAGKEEESKKEDC